MPKGLENNKLLGQLPEEEANRLSPRLEYVDLTLEQVLYERDQFMDHAYFPIDAIVSLIYEMENGESAEIAVIGNEGMIGVALFMGGQTMPNRAVVQSPGGAYRLDEKTLKSEFGRHGAVHDLLLRYTQALLTQMSQTAVCNRHHSVVQQLCRWLLLSIDRLPEDRLHMTQQLIADMLGVRRAGVTEAAGKLQEMGVISYNRGNITVLDRARLEQMACECYDVVRKETDRLMDYPVPGS